MLSNLSAPVIMKWQQIGNRKSAGQNNICNRMAEKTKQICLNPSLDLPIQNPHLQIGSIISDINIYPITDDITEITA